MSNFYKAIIIFVFVLLVGCSKTYVNQTNSDGESDDEHDGLSSWIGGYAFSEFYPPNINMFYSITIYQENDNYFADVWIDGFQTTVRLKAAIVGNDKAINFAFYDYLPDNYLMKCEKDEILLSFEKRDSKLYTNWGTIEPILEENKESGEYFEPSEKEQDNDVNQRDDSSLS